MQKIITFFKTFIRSATSPAYYADVFRARFSFSLKYFILFNALLATVTVAQVMVPLSAVDVQGLTNKIVATFPTDLVVRVKDGQLRINKPLPYVIPVPQDWNDKDYDVMDKNLIVFESDRNVQGLKDFFEYNTFILVTETSILVQSDEDRGEVKGYEIPSDMEPFALSSSMLYEAKDAFLSMPMVKNKWYVPLLGLLLLIVLIPAMTWFRFLTTLIYSLVMYVVALFVASALLKNRRFSFSKVLQFGLHTMTVTVVITYIINALSQAEVIRGWWFFGVYFVLTLVALWGAAQNLGTRVTATPVKTVTATSKSKKTSKKK